MFLVVSILVGIYIIYHVVSDILIQTIFHYGYQIKILPTATTVTITAFFQTSHPTRISVKLLRYFVADVLQFEHTSFSCS